MHIQNTSRLNTADILACSVAKSRHWGKGETRIAVRGSHAIDGITDVTKPADSMPVQATNLQREELPATPRLLRCLDWRILIADGPVKIPPFANSYQAAACGGETISPAPATA
ncbi:hypothetical protein M0D69_05045 [Caballeronia sp. SEWSISQ10-4 2]|uniref:hypothetical protein n=1 Tax=Caballeronia sp. SEWSISQ10-4 2 TaxID=2937438 RepID=UPI0026554DA8|nr:hypothetical protein [Caballeronia sp. SEWSISQ10-4 2]MDN7177391.1 hypothetical protein [Caballeronia sp. SEWSISQ10-4 2]